jgi:hypothetical protein
MLLSYAHTLARQRTSRPAWDGGSEKTHGMVVGGALYLLDQPLPTRQISP